MWIRRLSELAFAGWLGLAASDARAAPASAPEDALAEHRERFKQGMDFYEHGDAAQAIATWEPIYRDLGEQRGYRLAYDLGLAYAALDEASRSADRLQAFLNEVDSRRAWGEPLEAAVTKEESDARARLARLAAALGRVQLAPGSRPSVVRVDSGDPRAAGAVAWVMPGPHMVTFDPETPDQRTIALDVAAGTFVQLVPPPPTARPEPPPPAPAAPAASALGGAGSIPPPAPAESHAPRQAPVPPTLIAISGGATLAIAVAAVALEVHAETLREDDTAQQARSADRTIPTADRASFETARTWAYASVGAAAGLAGITAGLTTWYLLGKGRDRAHPAPGVGVRLDHSRLVIEGSF